MDENGNSKGFTHEKIRELLSEFKSLVYWCLSDEIGHDGTYHTHIYVAFSSTVRFTTVKQKFEGGHFEMCRGTSMDNKIYVFKEGKYLNDAKGDTNLRETHEEFGEMPIERAGSRNDLKDLYDMIKGGSSNFEIIESDPTYMLQIERLEKIRQTIKEEQFKNTFRQLEVNYIFGETGSGKTRSIMEKYGYTNVYRVTSYDHFPFDNYKGEDVILFEEFRSSLKITDMLNYLDGYPVVLPARYGNRIACYTKVYLLTNIPISEQYKSVQLDSNPTWLAFMRRINSVTELNKIEKKEITYNQSELKFTDFLYSLDDVYNPLTEEINKQNNISLQK